MEKAIIVFDDLTVHGSRVDVENNILSFNGKEYHVVLEDGYYIAPLMEKGNRIYLRFPTKKSKGNTGLICEETKKIKNYHHKTPLNTLKKAEKILEDCWDRQFEILLTHSVTTLRRINETGQLLIRIRELIRDKESIEQSKKEKISTRPKPKREKTVVEPKREQDKKEITRAFVVTDELLVDLATIINKVSKEEYIISYRGNSYTMVRENGYWTIPELPSHEVYISSPGNTTVCADKYVEYKGICNPVWDIERYNIDSPIEDLYEVERQLRECWSGRFDHLWSCRFVPMHVNALNKVANKIKEIRNIIERKERFALIVFSDLSVEELEFSRKQDENYIVIFGDEEFVMIRKEDYWTIPDLGYNEVYIREPNTCSFLATDLCPILAIEDIENPYSFSELYYIDNLLKECWTERFEFMIRCIYEPYHLTEINEVAERLVNIRKIIEEKG